MATYPKISVISPVYNVAPNIRKCIESLLSQTYSNFELILVDDGSTDESGTICDEYANRDSRIRVIHQTNQGTGAARNRGIQAAQGKYLIAPDPDDYVEPTYLEDLINATLEYPYDVVCSGYIKHIGAEIQTDQLSPFKCTTKQGVRDWLALNSFPKSEHWAYLFKLDLIKRYALEYPHISSGEDTLFLYHFFFYAESVCTITNRNYHYIIHPNTLSTRWNIENANQWLNTYVIIYEKFINDSISQQLLQRLTTIGHVFISRRIIEPAMKLPSHFQRVIALRTIPWNLYWMWTKPTSYRSSFYRFLVLHRLFHLYDFLYCIYTKPKR